jgi:hypothetical protein
MDLFGPHIPVGASRSLRAISTTTSGEWSYLKLTKKKSPDSASVLGQNELRCWNDRQIDQAVGANVNHGPVKCLKKKK